jgi:hypothetical protein
MLYTWLQGREIDVFKAVIYEWKGIMMLKYDTPSLYFFLPQTQTFGLLAMICGIYLYILSIKERSAAMALITGAVLGSMVLYHTITAFPALVALGLTFLYMIYQERRRLLKPEGYGIVAIAAIPLWEINKKCKLKKVFVSTYQAVSGAGRDAIEELEQQTKDYASGQDLKIEQFAHQILFNLIPHIDKFQENGYTKEEMKVVWEMRKIFGDDKLAISCTAVRVPVLRAHSETIVVETEEKINPREIKKIFSQTPGIKLTDEPEKNIYPMPINASGKYDVEVGRIRQNLVFGEHGLEFFVSGDQLLKGAALNAVQIAELLNQ